jgi:hypothetical protein
MNKPRPAERPLRSPPTGAVTLALLVGLLYFAELATMHDSGFSDPAGNALAGAFVALFAIALWIVLAGLVAFKNGRMPTWAAIGALVLLPLSGYASFTAANLYATNRGWTLIIPTLVPPVIVFYALWIRIPALVAALSEAFASALAGCALVALMAASIGGRTLMNLPPPRGRRSYKLPTKICAPSRKRRQQKIARAPSQIRSSVPTPRCAITWNTSMAATPAPARPWKVPATPGAGRLMPLRCCRIGTD